MSVQIRRAVCLAAVLMCCLMGWAYAANKDTVTIPMNTAVIEAEAFRGTAGKTVVLPDGVQRIEERAFANNAALTGINLPASLRFIADSAFDGCPNLTAQVEEFTYAHTYCREKGIPFQLVNVVLPKSLRITYGPRSLLPGQTEAIRYKLEPANARTVLTYTSSVPGIATVDDMGVVTGVSKGKARITVSTHNGITQSYEVTVTGDAAQLQFALLPDGSGYQITGCEATAYTVNIPASYNGLPVKAIAGEAFINCANLYAFTADPQQKTFYAVEGVLYTDSPVKTLVRCPNNLGRVSVSLTVPKDTKAIGDYAFAGQKSLEFLHLPEGLTSMGAYVFNQIQWQMSVYVPDSLTSIDENVMQGQKANVPFYGSADCYAVEFAQIHNIPYGMTNMLEPEQKTAADGEPDLSDAPDAGAVDTGNTVTIPFNDSYEFRVFSVISKYDLTEYQKQNPSEIRIELIRRWPEIIPDISGKTRNGYPAHMGLYGVGYTDGTAYLRGYDMNGNETGVRKVSGHFCYALPGAYDLGVSGGRNTLLTVMPSEPVYVSSAGSYPIDPDTLYTAPDGSGFQFYLMMFTDNNQSFRFPQEMNVMSYMKTSPSPSEWDTMDSPPYYSVLTVKLKDASRIPQSNLISIRFDYVQTLLKNSEFTCRAKASYGLTKAFAERIYEVFQEVKALMTASYYPPSAPISHVTVLLNGNYPSASQSIINLDDYFLDPTDGNLRGCAHEMVHAIDQSDGGLFRYFPSAWIEGRAEYISFAAADQMGFTYGGGLFSETYYTDPYNWSFLSSADKANFYDYFYESTNVNTVYPIGYFFIKYICANYGENVCQRVTEYMIAKNLPDGSSVSQAERKAAFLEAVTAETEANVFQNFVRDVLEN